MTEANSQQPPIAWRYCGSQIKLWRDGAGVTRQALADEANYDCETVKSMENGRRRPTIQLLEVADRMCRAGGKLVAAQQYLKPEKYPEFSQDFIRYEAEAIALSSYQPLLIPGLLQTEQTARALLNAHWPPLDDEEIEERVAARLARQAILGNRTRSFSFIIGEAAVTNPLGDPKGHRAQLGHLNQMATARNVSVQVMPAGGAHPGLNGPFVLLELAEHEHLAYEEGQTVGVLHSDAGRVSKLMQRHTMILGLTLSPAESARFIGRLEEEL
ncbi:helix-turn-helix domain-containing protein [Streptomyces sp. TRM66268-LWL]|uniref:Helix-turn-helix domain-containing protein n=1 Tax=Streptomyces polyasparticus TaxID=2767826 RepID=A0ABR7SR92_9ACTN|nr:helix-turn-helix transcriptional regulator [Streptomyces polyasparticus]MBC9717102.1 helix-turn-helix domain-containing protein [Streptomyces polyasparticus]